MIDIRKIGIPWKYFDTETSNPRIHRHWNYKGYCIECKEEMDGAILGNYYDWRG